jgi:hypothetical protein
LLYTFNKSCSTFWPTLLDLIQTMLTCKLASLWPLARLLATSVASWRTFTISVTLSQLFLFVQSFIHALVTQIGLVGGSKKNSERVPGPAYLWLIESGLSRYRALVVMNTHYRDMVAVRLGVHICLLSLKRLMKAPLA